MAIGGKAGQNLEKLDRMPDRAGSTGLQIGVSRAI
jgi:hypothetical protein